MEISSGIALINLEVNIPKLLLIRIRSSYYELPKGHLEENETLIDASIRELREETFLNSKINYLSDLGFIEYFFDNVNSKKVHYYLFETIEEPFFEKRNKRLKELRWIDNSEIDKISFVSEDLKKIVQKSFFIYNNLD